MNTKRFLAFISIKTIIYMCVCVFVFVFVCVCVRARVCVCVCAFYTHWILGIRSVCSLEPHIVVRVGER